MDVSLWKAAFVSNSNTTKMVFKKSLAALVLALPLVLGMSLFFNENVHILIVVAGLPSKRALNPKCAFLEPIKADLIENLFTNECGDTVSLLSSLL